MSSDFLSRILYFVLDLSCSSASSVPPCFKVLIFNFGRSLAILALLAIPIRQIRVIRGKVCSCRLLIACRQGRFALLGLPVLLFLSHLQDKI
jgi:hypothetical protein